MADYQLTQTSSVIRNSDDALVPDDPFNRDWQEYQKWLADGSVPDPYVAPPTPAPEPTPEDEVLFNHENRIRSLEGQPPLTQADFAAQARPT